MIYKKGEISKKLPPGSTILRVSVWPTGKNGQAWAGQMINLTMYAAFKRENVRMPFGRWYFYRDPDNFLHIHPTPERALLVKVRYMIEKEC